MRTMVEKWTPVTEVMPDDEIAVLIACNDQDEPVWIGYHDDEQWRDASGAPAVVTHWRDLPAPPGDKSFE